MSKKKQETDEQAAQQATNPGTDTDTQTGANAPDDDTQDETEQQDAAGSDADTTIQEEAKESKKAKEPKVSDALAKAGKALLDSNPGMSVVYMTSDGRGFYEKNDAENYARTLKNKAVTPVKK